MDCSEVVTFALRAPNVLHEMLIVLCFHFQATLRHTVNMSNVITSSCLKHRNEVTLYQPVCPGDMNCLFQRTEPRQYIWLRASGWDSQLHIFSYHWINIFRNCATFTHQTHNWIALGKSYFLTFLARQFCVDMRWTKFTRRCIRYSVLCMVFTLQRRLYICLRQF